jgi:acyl-CoA synthetase (AMP-forming)/AMP-acid ligase II
VDVLRGHALRQKDQAAVSYLSDEGVVAQTVTYSKLDQQARSIAAWLQQQNLFSERVILVYAHSREFLPAFLGCLYAGAVAVPTHIPRRLRFLDRLQAIRADSNPRAVLTAAETLEACQQAFPAQEGEMAWLATDSLEDGSANWAPPLIELSTLAFLQYTSGSTASPRGVMVRHANLMHNLKLSHRMWASDSESVVLSWLPFFHDMGLIGAMLGALFVGCPLFLMSPASFMQRPLRWLQAITRYRATHSGAPNFAFDHCVRSVCSEDRQSLDLSSWRVAWNGAEPLLSATLERFHAAFASCGFQFAAHAPCYGLAEATLMVSGTPCGERAVHRLVDREALGQHRVVSAAGQPDSRAVSLVSSGRIGADLKVLIVHPETRQVCSQQEVGEIWVAGPSVAGGYWNQPEKSAETFAAQTADDVGPFLRTGDLGCLWQGELFIIARVKELIIIRGRNYYPTDLERTAWTSHPALQQHGGAAFSVSASDETERVVLVHEVRREAVRSLESAEVFGAIRRAVADQHEVSVGAVVLLKPGQLPRTSSGKIRRLACATAFLRGDMECLAQWQETSPEASEDHFSPDENLAATFREASAGQRERLLTEWVQRVVQEILHMPTLPGPDLLVEMGMDSLQVVTLRSRLEAGIGRPVQGTLALERATIAEVVTSLLREISSMEEPTLGPHEKPLLPTPQPEQKKYLPRKLSGIESIVWGGGRLTVNAAGIVRVRGVFTEAALVEAIAVVQARHPLLSVRIRLDKDGYPWFVTDTALRLPLRVVERQSEDHWRHEVARELGTPFDGLTGVLARFVCLRSNAVSELVFCCHHALADGLSVRNALRDLLEAMGRPGTRFDPLPERPSIETWIPAELAAVVAAMPPLKPPAHVQAGHGAPLGHRSNLRVLSWLLQEEDTAALLTRAGEEQTSVHGAFCAAFLLAHNDLYGYQPRRTVSCPVSLRGRFGIPNENDFGLYMALSEVTVDCSERGDVWVMARAITAALDQRSADPMLLLPIAALRSQVAAMPYAQAVELSLAGIGKISYDLSVTNLGRLDSPDAFGGLQVEEVFGAVLGPDAEKVVAVCMTHRRISLTMTFNVCVTTEAMARRLVDAALGRLVVRGGIVAGSRSGT